MIERSSINERRVPRVNGVKDYSQDLVISADGTTIGVRRFGRGPGLVLLHGGVNAAKHMMRLGERLADAYTIYLPDRRGRGTSGPYGSRYCIGREDEDLAAVIDHSGAEFVFGPADGGLFALHGSIGIKRVRRVAAYEPLLLLDDEDDAAIRRTFMTMQGLIRIRTPRRGHRLLRRRDRRAGRPSGPFPDVARRRATSPSPRDDGATDRPAPPA